MEEKLKLFVEAVTAGMGLRESAQMLKVEGELVMWLRAYDGRREPYYSALDPAFVGAAQAKLRLLQHLHQAARTRPKLALRLVALRNDLDGEKADILSANPDAAKVSAKAKATRDKLLLGLTESFTSPNARSQDRDVG